MSDPSRNDVIYANEFRIDSMIPEGPDAGRRCVTIRLSGCNLTCEECDQPSTWGHHMTSRPVRAGVFLDHINHAATHTPIGDVLITGGEPLLQQDDPGLRYLVESLIASERAVHVDTNGSIEPADWWWEGNPQVGTGLIRWRVSPKIFGALATDPKTSRIRTKALRWFARHPHAQFLFPCANPTEIGGVRQFRDNYRMNPNRVWIYPLGMEKKDVVLSGPSLAETAIRSGFNISTRLSIMMSR